MSWRKKVTDNIADFLKFTAYIFFAFDLIMISGFLFWFVGKFIWHSAQYINHHLFGKPWF